MFNAIYEADYWDTPESKSGGGSTIKATAQYVPQLIAAINELGVKSMFDAPCGDLNWMPLVIDQTGIIMWVATLPGRRSRSPDLAGPTFRLSV